MDCSTFAFDLHVLGTPPALILSQDQTLMLILFDWRYLAVAARRNLLTRAPVDLALALFVLRVGSGLFPCGVHPNPVQPDPYGSAGQC